MVVPSHKKSEKEVEVMAFAKEDMVWQERGWKAEIIRDDDGAGWAIAMTPDGADEPVYTAPWTMGRNKKDPKPLKTKDFLVWIKSAKEFVERSSRQTRHSNRKSIDTTDENGDFIRVVFDVVNHGEAKGSLTAFDQVGQELESVECDPNFKLTVGSAEDWILGGYGQPFVEEESYVEEESFESFEDVSYEETVAEEYG